MEHGIWGGLAERERRPLRTRRLRAVRRERDRTIAAAHSKEVIGRSFGLSRTSVTRIVRNDRHPDGGGQ
jgi:hypothetical protein